jgi:RimJ/RimL family protein N-acetyltransferase
MHHTENHPGTELRETAINEPNTHPIIWLEHDGVGLGPFDPDLVESYWRWENEPRVMVGYGRQNPESLIERTAGVNSQVKYTDNQARFTIYTTSGGTPVPVGTTALVIDHRLRIAEFFILIGDQEHRGQGTGTKATRLTLDYAFHITNLRCVYLSVLEPNTAGVKAYEKAGFRTIGVRRNSGYWLGQPANEVLMDAIPEDFEGPSMVAEKINPSE